MIVHRDYAIPKPSHVDVIPNHALRFINPATPLPQSTSQLTLGPDGGFEPVPEFSDLRNRALCDVFFGISAMERAGTGLIDARDLSTQQGGAANFAYPPGEDSFVSELFRLEASAGSTSVGRDTRPMGTYVINLLPFAAIPDQMTHIEINILSWGEIERKVPLSEVSTFLFEGRAGDLWTFMPEVLVNSFFGPVAKGPARTIPLAEVEADKVLHTKFSWLTRKHFENYLKQFEGVGLVIEKDRKGRPARRAYFTALKGNNRPIIYDTPNRKGSGAMSSSDAGKATKPGSNAKGLATRSSGRRTCGAFASSHSICSPSATVSHRSRGTCGRAKPHGASNLTATPM